MYYFPNYIPLSSHFIGDFASYSQENRPSGVKSFSAAPYIQTYLHMHTSMFSSFLCGNVSFLLRLMLHQCGASPMCSMPAISPLSCIFTLFLLDDPSEAINWYKSVPSVQQVQIQPLLPLSFLWTCLHKQICWKKLKVNWLKRSFCSTSSQNHFFL